MESTQGPAAKAVLSNEDQVMLEELLKNHKQSEDQDQGSVYGVISNTSMRVMTLKEINIYSGHWVTSGPSQTLYEKKGFTYFVHQATPPKGSKVGVAYINGGHQWLMAWSVPLETPSLLRVYVEDGAEAPIDWKLIEEKLDASGSQAASPGAVASISMNGVAAGFREPRPLN